MSKRPVEKQKLKAGDVPYFVNDYTVWSGKESFYAKLGFEGPEEEEALLVRFTMTPTTAKGIMLALKKLVDDHEAEYGEIRAPPTVAIKEEGPTEEPKPRWKPAYA